jgi:HlyD family secretion protein
MSRKKILLLVLGAAALVVVLVWGFRSQPVAVEAVPVTRGRLMETVEEEAVVRVRERYTVSASVPGLLRRVEFEVGAPVRAGAVVAVIEPVPSPPLDARTAAEAAERARVAEATLRQARDQAAAAETQVDLARRELARVRPLAEDSILAASEFDRYAAAARQAEAAAAAARDAVAAARHQRDAAVATLAAGGRAPARAVAVTAPVDGVVLAVYQESEGVVAAGQPLLDVGDAEDLEVVAEVLTVDAVQITPGTRVLVEDWGGAVPLEGVVERVEPVAQTTVSALGVEEQRARVHVALPDLALLETPVRLGDGYRVTARFVLWEGDSVLLVPTSALFHDGDGWAVFVVEAEVVRQRPVEVGHRDGLQAEVLRGLAPGDLVLTHPSDAVTEGVRVAVE